MEGIWNNKLNYIFWWVSLVLGFSCFLFGIYYFIKKKDSKNRLLFSAIIESVACWILYVPFEISKNYQGNGLLWQIINSSIVALLKTVTKYLGEGYEEIYYDGRPLFSIFYGGLMATINILMLLFAGGLIIRFLHGPFQKVRLFRNRNRYFYVFYGYNKKIESIASSIPDTNNCNLLFVFSDEDVSEDTERKIEEMGGVVLCDGISLIIKRYISYAKGVEVFLFDDDEHNNLLELNDICEKINGSDKQVRFYVELSKTPWDMYDNYIDKFDLPETIVNFVRAEENFAYNNLLSNSIFKHYYTDNSISVNDRIIKIILLGFNERNVEMLKAVLHLSQMPGYFPIIGVIDDEERRDYLYKLMPEVLDKYSKKGDAIYRLEYRGGVDFNSKQIIDIINKDFSDFTFAFVNYGDDLDNINMALSLRCISNRNNRKDGYKIQVSVEDASICKYWDEKKLDGISVVGEIKEVYKYSFITMSDIEKISKGIHEIRHGNSISWQQYCNNEYNRHSVYARTLSFRHKVHYIKELGLDYSVSSEKDPWLLYEHMRWNMYTRTLGYVVPSGEVETEINGLTDKIEEGNLDKEQKNALKSLRQSIRSNAKVHEDLIEFEKLLPGVQSYDGLKLKPEIIAEFEKIDIEE